jgi:hypothetical protein
MEASVATPQAVADPEPSHDGAAEATRSTQELFRWSGFVHVGAGAEQCEHRLDGQCKETPRTNPETGGMEGHFHAWICLPNPYQVRDIQEKARAARARKVRALRDPESDSGVILEGELDELRREHMDELVQAIASRNVDAELMDIVREVQEREEFENQAADAEEFQRLQQIPEVDRTSEEQEEHTRLAAQMLKYGETMQEILDKRREAEVERLKGLDPDKVIDIEREFRIKSQADEMFLFTYYTWAIYVGTREPTATGMPTQRKFPDAQAQRSAPPEVVNALREKIRELESATTQETRGDAAGN